MFAVLLFKVKKMVGSVHIRSSQGFLRKGPDPKRHLSIFSTNVASPVEFFWHFYLRFQQLQIFFFFATFEPMTGSTEQDKLEKNGWCVEAVNG